MRTRSCKRIMFGGNDLVSCPIDLDSIILSDDCTPEKIENDLDVSDDILYDAIRLSSCSSWLLNIDVFDRFSDKFKMRLLGNSNAFGSIDISYFRNKCQRMQRYDLIEAYEKCKLMNSVDAMERRLVESTANLTNPSNMLSNDNVRYDNDVAYGKMSLRKMLLNRIQLFLKDGDNHIIDFSKSLFLIDLLSPKFFSMVSDAEQLVILSNLDRYFNVINMIRRTGLTGHAEKNTPLCLLKHVLSEDGVKYGIKVRDMAWNKFFQGISDNYKPGIRSPFYKYYDNELLTKHINKTNDFMPFYQILTESEGLFEAFELECTLKNKLAVDYMIEVSLSEYWKMTDGMMKFQDENERNKLYSTFSSFLTIDL